MGGGSNYWSRLQCRRVSRRRFLVGGGVAAAGSAALLAGCGGDTPKPAPVATEAPTATAEVPPATAEVPPATAEAPEATPAASPSPTATPTPDPYAYRRGGTLWLWKWGKDAGLDPGVFHLNNRDIIYSTLTQPLTYQPTKNLVAMDGMVGYEQVDPLTLVWSIRPGMKFHNGDPVDSEAVAFSFGRLAKLGDVFEARGDNTHLSRAGFEFVDSFEATDELTMTEHWSRTNADALVHRARHYYSFLNPRVVEEQGVLEGIHTAPDGTTEDVYSIQDLPFGSGSGPYVLTKRDATGTRVERWPDYHKHTPADDGFVEDGPYIDAWEARVIPDQETATAAFLAGDLDVLDWASLPEWRRPVELPELVEFRDHVNVVEIPGGGYAHQGMDGGKFHDRRSRMALRKAFDYEGFIEAIRPEGGKYAAPISDLLPHFQQLSQTDLKRWYRYDPREARALWAAADFAVPVEQIRIFGGYRDFGLQSDIHDFLAQSLREGLGVETEVWYLGPMEHSPVTDRSAPVKSWDLLSYGTGEGGSTSGIPYDTHLIHYDPHGYGYSAFNHYADSPRPEIAADSVELTAMLEQQGQETDFDTRAELLTEIQRWILDRAWSVLPLPVSRVQHYAFSSRLQDFAPDDWVNYYGLRRESMWLVPD